MCFLIASKKNNSELKGRYLQYNIVNIICVKKTCKISSLFLT